MWDVSAEPVSISRLLLEDLSGEVRVYSQVQVREYPHDVSTKRRQSSRGDCP